MNNINLVIALTLCAVAMMAKADNTRIDVSKAPELFEKFQKDYNRVYKDEADKQVHYQAFVKALNQINANNAADPHATFGINQFTDYTEEEQKHMFGLLNDNKPQ